MPIVKTNEPIFAKTPQGHIKVGFKTIQITTDKEGNVTKSVCTKTHMYKWLNLK